MGLQLLTSLSGKNQQGTVMDMQGIHLKLKLLGCLQVSFGLLHQPPGSSSGVPQQSSRWLMAVPFVGKDRPSPASEFAHPVSLMHVQRTTDALLVL